MNLTSLFKKEDKESNALTLVFSRKEELAFEVDKEGLVSVIKVQNHPIQRLFRRMGLSIPDKSVVTLDRHASFVFLAFDGRRSVQEVASLLLERFGSEVEPLYPRLLPYIEHLEKNARYIEAIAP